MPRHFHETLIQAQVVSNRILPALLVLLVVRKVFHDILVDAVKRESFLGTAADGHHDEGIVAVSGFLVLFLVVVRLRGSGRRRLGARDVELGVGRAGGAGRGFGQQVANCETVRRSHSGAASRAASSLLKAQRPPRRGPALALRPTRHPSFHTPSRPIPRQTYICSPIDRTAPTYGRFSSDNTPTTSHQRSCDRVALGLKNRN